MPIKQCLINRDASILYRCSRSFYDRCLSRFGMTSGMPFFLLRISETPGLTQSQLVEKARFDKATTQRAVQKLQRLGFISISADLQDHRVQHLYLTEKAYPVLEECYRMLEDWQSIITADLTPEEVKTVETLLAKAADAAYHYQKNCKA